MASVRSSFVLQAVQWQSQTAIYLFSFMAVARLLTPAEIGVFFIAAALSGVCLIVATAGADRYLVQLNRVEPEHIVVAFGLAALAALVTAAALFLSAGPLATFYGDPRLKSVLHTVAFAQLIVPFWATAQGLLQRHMAFSAIYVVNTVAALVGAVVSISMAMAGFGPVSLAWGLVAEITIRAILSLLFGRETLRMTRSWPALPVWVHGARFSGAAVATSLVLGLHDALPQIVVGRVLGAEATGFFNRAQRIVQLLEEALNTSIKNVALSSLARAQRASIDLGEPFRRKIAYLSAIAWPTFLIIALTADPVIRVLLGREWVTIVPLLQLSCLGGLVLPFTAVNIGFFTVLNHLQLLLRLQLGLLAVRGLVVVVAAHFGLLAVAGSIILVQLVGAIITTQSLCRILRITLRESLGSAASSLFVTASTVAAAALAFNTLQVEGSADASPISSLIVLVGVAVAAAPVWLGAIVLLDHPFKVEVVIAFTKLRDLFSPLWPWRLRV